MKKIGIIAVIILLCAIEGFIMYFSFNNKETSNDIPTNYIAAFKGETSETVYTTYLYETKKGKKITYNYINTISRTNTYDDTSGIEQVTKKGKLKKKNDIYKIAEKNNAYTFVKKKDDEKLYTIEDFKKEF